MSEQTTDEDAEYDLQYQLAEPPNAALISYVRNAERERCARIAEEHPDDCQWDHELARGCCEMIAAQIRCGK